MTDSIFSEYDLSGLKSLVCDRLSEKRFIHTLGVAQAAHKLGKILMPDKCRELIIAALLHDIAKELDDVETEKLLSISTFPLTNEDLAIKPALHAISGAELIKRDFHEFANKDILSAVYNHTVGSPDMNMFSEIIFISDYIEEGRTYYYSKIVRDFLFDSLKSTDEVLSGVKLLHTATVMILNHTIESLSRQSKPIHSRAVLTKNSFASLI